MNAKIDKEKKITLYNRDFDEMRNMLDVTLRQTFKAMIDKGMDAAAIGLKIDITLHRTSIADNDAPLGTREAINPEVGYKISAVMQSKGEYKGDAIPHGSDELLMDSEGDFYVVSREEASGQLNMFGSWDEFKEATREN